MLPHIECLEVTVESENMIVELVDRLEHLERVVFERSNDIFFRNICPEWLQRNIRRLNANNFTMRIEDDTGCVYLSIDDTKQTETEVLIDKPNFSLQVSDVIIDPLMLKKLSESDYLF
jgi:hypothetical protein